MLTEEQIKQDASDLVEELVLDLRARGLTLNDEKSVLINAANILTTASHILVNMLRAKTKMTMH